MNQLSPLADLLSDESITVIEWTADFNLLFTYKGNAYLAYSKNSEIVLTIQND
jgi:hypothetical protein